MKTISETIAKFEKRLNFLKGFSNQNSLFIGEDDKIFCKDFSLTTEYSFCLQFPVMDENLDEREQRQFSDKYYYPTKVNIAKFFFYSKIKNSQTKRFQNLDNFKEGLNNSIFEYVEYNDNGGKDGLYNPKWYKKEISFLQTQEKILSSSGKLNLPSSLFKKFKHDLSEIYILIPEGEFQYNKELPYLDYLIKRWD